MDIPSYDNAEKWCGFFKQLPPNWKTISTSIIFLLFLGLVLWNEFSRIPKLNEKISSFDKNYNELRIQKDDEIRRKNDLITSIREDYNKIHAENLHLKEIQDPIRRKAEQLYPQLEINAAISKILEDIEKVEYLATRDQIRPLESEVKGLFFESIRTFINKYTGRNPEIIVTSQVGNQNRERLAKYLVSLINESGLKVNYEGTVIMEYSGNQPSIEIIYNEGNQEYCTDFIQSLSQYIKSKYHIVVRQKRGGIPEELNGIFKKNHVLNDEKLDRYHLSNELFKENYHKDLNDILEIQIIGEPEFLPNGVVVMK